MTELVQAFVELSSKSLVLVERDGDEISFKRQLAEYSCYINQSDVPPLLYQKMMASKSILDIQAEGSFYKIFWRDKESCKEACDRLASKGLDSFDGDLSPVRRYLIESKRKIARPRRCYLDIETDSRVSFKNKERARILCWVIIGDDGKEHRGALEDNTDKAEAKLVQALFDALYYYDQVVAWNGDRFDFEVIKARARTLLKYIEMRRWLMLDFMVLFQRMNTMAAESGEEKQSFALESIAQAVLGYGKNKFDASKTWQAWENNTPCDTKECAKCRSCLVEYCSMDVKLMPALEARKGYIELFQTICDVCSVFASSYGTNPTEQVEGFLLAIAKDRGYKFKTKKFVPNDGQYKGAYVMKPTKAGILKNVHVCDYKSLYPSIIMTWNISPETFVAHNPGDVKPDWVAECPLTGHWFDQRVEGILPYAVSELLRLRVEWQKKESELPPNTPEWREANARSTAYKITANSFYGVIGSIFSRFFRKDVAEAITQCGVWLIQAVLKAGEERGCEGLAVDTDGSFVMGSTPEDFKDFIFNHCNKKMIPEMIAACGCRQNFIKLNYDKTYERLIIPINAKGEFIAKKYCGRLLVSKGAAASDDSEPEIKGLEYKRGDSTKFGRMMQKEVIDLFCKHKSEDLNDFILVINKFKNTILNEELALDDIKVAKRLGKPIYAYAQKIKKDGTLAAQPAHVRMAKILEERGEDVSEGTKIAFVVTDAENGIKAVPASDYDGTVDRFKLWEKDVWPPSRRLIVASFPDYDWTEFDKVRPRKRRKSKKEEVPVLSKEEQDCLFSFLDDPDLAIIEEEKEWISKQQKN